MSVSKGHDKPRPDMCMKSPIELLPDTKISLERIEELHLSLKRKTISPRTYGLMKRLWEMDAATRLAVNLKSVLGLMLHKNVDNVLVDGLTEDEREALSEIDASGFSVSVRETAHTLLDIQQRIVLVTTFSRLFRDRKTLKLNISPKPLD